MYIKTSQLSTPNPSPLLSIGDGTSGGTLCMIGPRVGVTCDHVTINVGDTLGAYAATISRGQIGGPIVTSVVSGNGHAPTGAYNDVKLVFIDRDVPTWFDLPSASPSANTASLMGATGRTAASESDAVVGIYSAPRAERWADTTVTAFNGGSGFLLSIDVTNAFPCGEDSGGAIASSDGLTLLGVIRSAGTAVSIYPWLSWIEAQIMSTTNIFFSNVEDAGGSGVTWTNIDNARLDDGTNATSGTIASTGSPSLAHTLNYYTAAGVPVPLLFGTVTAAVMTVDGYSSLALNTALNVTMSGSGGDVAAKQLTQTAAGSSMTVADLIADQGYLSADVIAVLAPGGTTTGAGFNLIYSRRTASLGTQTVNADAFWIATTYTAGSAQTLTVNTPTSGAPSSTAGTSDYWQFIPSITGTHTFTKSAGGGTIKVTIADGTSVASGSSGMTASLTGGTTYYVELTTPYATTPYALTVSSPPPTKASTPDPAHSSTQITTSPVLAWTDGGGSTSYKVYVGPSGGSLTLRGSPSTASLSIAGLSVSTAYDWRIDSVNAGGTTTGDVWTFTTAASSGGSGGNWRSRGR